MRIAEKNNDAIADEFVNGAAEVSRNARHFREVAVEQPRDFFGLPARSRLSEVFDVREKYSQLFAFGVNLGGLRAFEQQLVHLGRQVARQLFRQRLQPPGVMAAFQMRLHPRHHHRRADRFGDVVNSAHVQAQLLFFDGA